MKCADIFFKPKIILTFCFPKHFDFKDLLRLSESNQFYFQDHYNVLHIAAMYSREDVVKLLLNKRGVDPFSTGGVSIFNRYSLSDEEVAFRHIVNENSLLS